MSSPGHAPFMIRAVADCAGSSPDSKLYTPFKLLSKNTKPLILPFSTGLTRIITSGVSVAVGVGDGVKVDVGGSAVNVEVKVGVLVEVVVNVGSLVNVAVASSVIVG